MAKAVSKKAMTATTDQYKGKAPTPYGSHASIIDQDWTGKVNDSKYFILEGDFGFYATTKDRLDNGLADPNRWASPEYRAKLLKKLLPMAEISIQEEKVSLK